MDSPSTFRPFLLHLKKNPMDKKPRPFYIRVLLRYFVQGLLFMMPIAITIWIFVYVISMFQDYYGNLSFWIALPAVLVSVFVFGYLSSTLFAKPLFTFLEEVLSHAPLIKLVYTSIKDLTEAFVGDKKKFDKPVLIKLDQREEIYRVGFLTREDLRDLSLPGMVSVYIPMSYSFSGNMVIVPKELLKPIEANSTEMMRFVVSGGVTGI